MQIQEFFIYLFFYKQEQLIEPSKFQLKEEKNDTLWLSGRRETKKQLEEVQARTSPSIYVDGQMARKKNRWASQKE